MAELSELDVLIVDCQTTGASPALGAVLELGWGVVRASSADIQQLQAHWIALPEGHVVPFQVRRLTGFDRAQHTEALPPKEAWERLRITMGPTRQMPAAIHFAKFELAFLRDWANRFEPETSFPLDTVCVHAIACHLYPDLPRRSLRALAGYLGYSLNPARRCFGHVEATAFIWRKLGAELVAQGVHTWAELGDWLAAPRPARSRKRRYPLPSARYRSLPDDPGVYRFVRSNGDVLYIGKAASLRKRVASHFTAGSSTTERALEMLTQVHDVQVTLTETSLEAAVLENQSIKSLNPPYNVQLLVLDPRTWFSNENCDAVSASPDDIHRFGPLPSTFSVRALGALLALSSGATATPAVRARAVGASERWAPDETVFAAGFGGFAERHLRSLAGTVPSARRALVAAAKNLLLTRRSEPASQAEAGIDGDEAEVETTATGAWDPARVIRHLERNLAHGYQLLRRARWLCLLDDSVVAFREAERDRSRLLVIRHGSIVEARDQLPDEPLTPLPLRQPLRDRQAAFDRSRYDQLRILTTELKRVLRENGTVEVRVGRGRLLQGSTLRAFLLWV